MQGELYGIYRNEAGSFSFYVRHFGTWWVEDLHQFELRAEVKLKQFAKVHRILESSRNASLKVGSVTYEVEISGYDVYVAEGKMFVVLEGDIKGVKYFEKINQLLDNTGEES